MEGRPPEHNHGGRGRSSRPQELQDARPRRRSPFSPVAPAVAVTVAYAVAAAVWVVAGDHLPGGRWLAVHLFTLGVLTNAVLAFSMHFGHTVTRAPEQNLRWQPAVLNAGVVLVLIGIPTGILPATATGATITMAVVLDAYVRLRRMRRQAVGARFAWIARVYERAHGAFIHGATLGLLLGTGVLTGTWYGAGRVAHLHINILGWAGLTLLATLVFFGPTMLRTRIEDGADDAAAAALRTGATTLTVAVLLLLATGVGGGAATALRVAAAAGLGVYAWAVTVVCVPVLRVAARAKPSATRPPLLASCAWFVAVAWIDVAVIATGHLPLLDALGLAALIGVLGQAIATALTYVAPALRGRTNTQRGQLTARMARGAMPRTITYNTGAVAVVAAAAGGANLAAAGAFLTAVGWVLVIATLAIQVAAGLWPLGQRHAAGA
jgi:hypothetical protein